MTVTDNGQFAQVATVPPVPIRVHIDAVRVAVGRVEAIVAILVDWFDGLNWHNTGPQQLEQMAFVLGVVAEKAIAAVAAVDRFETLVADQQPATPGPDDAW
jgi:hypothetical protein